MVSLGTLTMLAALAAPSSGQPVLLDFTATWCTPCRLMDKTVERLQREGYEVRTVDIDLQVELAAEYGVRQIPCFVMIAGGREVDRVVGPTTFARLQRMFQTAADATRAKVSPAGGLVSRNGNDWPGNQATEPLGPRPPANGHHDPTARQPRKDNRPSVDNRPREETDPRPREPSPVELALAATVRITVEDHTHNSYGTGTIIDQRGDEALILTCGHIFRASEGHGQVQVDLFSKDGRHTSLPGVLLDYTLERDLALITIQPGRPVTTMRVASTACRPRPKDRVFSVGCGHGGPPRVEESHISTINRYTGYQNIEVAGQPVSGRSGGGLFTIDGRLIGVCNARDREDDEGIYAALPEVQWMLANSGLKHVFERPAPTIADTRLPAPPVSTPARQTVPPGTPRDNPHSWDRLTRNEQALVDALKRHGENAEVICIVRSRNESPSKSELIVLENPSPSFLGNLSREFVSQRNDARRTTSLETAPTPDTPAASQQPVSASARQAAMAWHARGR
jgi:thiol-disulfide isomerase/thioredoxin